MLDTAMTEPYILLIGENAGTRAVRADGSTEMIDESPVSYLNRICCEYGSTMKGRTDAVSLLTGWKQKLPVLISETIQVIWFPVISPSDPDCIWICSNYILRVKDCDGASSEILFSSGLRRTVPVSSRSVRKQVRRCRTLRDLLNQNAEKNMPAGCFR